jgi:heme-degrading monooxygenase HmoA
MIAVHVTFKYDGNFDESKVRKIAEGAGPKFEGMPGLRCKVFTTRPEKREAINFYLWDSEEAARAFFSDKLLESVTALYGVRPTVEYAQVAVAVENHPF